MYYICGIRVRSYNFSKFNFKVMKKFYSLLLSAILVMSIGTTEAQTVKSLVKSAKKEIKAENYANAITILSTAIKADTSDNATYALRAYCYEKTGENGNAAKDYKTAAELNQNDASLYANSGRLYYKLNMYEDAVAVLNNATDLDKKNMEALRTKVLALNALENYTEALKNADRLVLLKKNDLNYYLHGITSHNLGNYDVAKADFIKAIKDNSKYEEAYLALATTYIALENLPDALEQCNKVINLNDKNMDAFLLRSQVYYKQADYTSSLSDLSLLIANSPENETLYFKRGKLYQETNEQDKAITDFCKVLSLDKDYSLAYFERAVSYEKSGKTDMAITDYKTFSENATGQDVDTRDALQKARERIYFLNREGNKPVINVNEPTANISGALEIRKDSKTTTVKGIIQDESDIEYLLINGEKYVFPVNATNNEFEKEVDLEAVTEITITASDIYHNQATTKYAIARTEIDPPTIHLLQPYASDDGEIYLESSLNSIYINGKITDDSKIKSIIIEGTYASFSPDDINPEFTATVNIANKSTLKVLATDIYGNKQEAMYTLNREGIELAADNPMGKTWLVFIENSNYETFASLDGPGKDISMMKSAFTNYDIHKIIHKKDMSKEEMARFFSIELRDLVRNNHVNSLIIWYSGHGKFVHETGYWIPVNATRDDEFTYFNINSLKASMQSYSKNVTHTLVITDACESGPSFYMAMRSTPKERDCGNWQATRFKSSQVFTSAGNELASDNSQFTQTFANTLKYNPDDCIAIENVVIKVTEAVSDAGIQKPKFGKIAGLEDEDGTFFFIKKAK